jgi:DNA-binding NarL/FixJ family response regulator
VSDEPIRIVVADDHPLFREGLRAVVAADPGLEVVAEASTGEEVVERALALQPDVVVMDLRMPGCSGVDATRRIVRDSPHVAVLVLTMLEDDDSLFAAMRAGARGYLLKGAGQDEILAAVRAVARGEAIFGPALAERLIAYFAAAPAGPAQVFPELTAREREVLERLARGESNRAIAGRLSLSEKTVRNNVSNIFTKLQVADRSQAIVRAREAGLGT